MLFGKYDQVKQIKYNRQATVYWVQILFLVL